MTSTFSGFNTVGEVTGDHPSVKNLPLIPKVFFWNNYYYIRLTAFFKDNLRKPAPET